MKLDICRCEPIAFRLLYGYVTPLQDVGELIPNSVGDSAVKSEAFGASVKSVSHRLLGAGGWVKCDRNKRCSAYGEGEEGMQVGLLP